MNTYKWRLYPGNYNPSTKKKTPLEYRMQQPQIKESAKPLTMTEKKLFKEAFNTDKSRLYKRHPKYGPFLFQTHIRIINLNIKISQ